jgi:serine/threonine-protein kinase HipA
LLDVFDFDNQILQQKSPPPSAPPSDISLYTTFDYSSLNEHVLRKHMIDACQLLNKARGFKYKAATLETLSEVIKKCRTKPLARLRLFQWLVFNALVGNGDNHLKNISFMVSDEGIEISPGYDLLSTAAYSTRALNFERATWPNVDLALPLSDAKRFGDVTRQVMLNTGLKLGLRKETVTRELDQLVNRIRPTADELCAEIQRENEAYPTQVKAAFANELRVLRTIRHIIIEEMATKLQPPPELAQANGKQHDNTTNFHRRIKVAAKAA